MNFTPNKETLEEILNTLNDLLSTSTKTVNKATNKMHILHDKLSDYSNYLTFILSTKEFSENLRRMASLFLGGVIEDTTSFKDLSYIQKISIEGLEDPNVDYSCARLILSMIKVEGVTKLHQILPLILKKNCQGAFHILEEICQNYSSEIKTKEIINYVEKFIKKGMDIKIHSSILHIVTILVEDDSRSGLESTIEKLFEILPHTTEEELRQDYCLLVINLFERNDLTLIENHLKLIFNFLLQCSSSSNAILIEAATDCWESFEISDPKSLEIFEDFLTKLIPTLTSQIIKVKESLPLNLLDDYEIFKKDVRRTSVEALEYLSRTQGPLLCKIILPIIKERISMKDVLVKESGILALGVLSQSELPEIYKFVQENIDFLILQLEFNSDPIVTKTTLWTLSKYYLIMNENKEISDKLIQRIIYFLIQEDAQIQHASLSLFITILECEKLNQQVIIENISPILQSLLKCFSIYKDKTNQANLLESITILFEYLYDISIEKIETNLIDEMIKVLMIKLNHSNADDDTSIILSCLTSISVTFPDTFQKYTPTLVNKSLNMIKEYLENPSYKDIVISCIDFISESVHYFDSFNFELSPLILYTTNFINSHDQEIKQSGFGLLGELIKKDLSFFNLKEIYPILLNTIEKDINYSNNAIWTFGEICIREDSSETKILAQKILPLLIDKLKFYTNTHLKGTSAITLGKIQISFPILTCSFFKENLKVWLQTLIATTEKRTEKKEIETIFKTLAITTRYNPDTIVNNIQYISQILNKWENWSKLDLMFEMYHLKSKVNEIDKLLRENGVLFDDISTQQRLKSNLDQEYFTDVIIL